MKRGEGVFKRIGVLCLCAMVTLSFCGCTWRDNLLHKEVERRVERMYRKDQTEYTAFEVYPLYDENDEIAYFMVEFEPSGFVMIEFPVRRWLPAFLIQMRTDGRTARGSGCNYKQYDPEGRKEAVDYDGHAEGCSPATDCYISPYRVHNITTEKRYVFPIRRTPAKVFAVKQGDHYLNVVTGETFTFHNGRSEPEQLVGRDLMCYIKI